MTGTFFLLNRPIAPITQFVTMRKHPRKALAARAQVVWTDSEGLRRSNAMLEDISLGGVSLRIGTSFGVGSRLEVSWFREQFSGTVRHCRPSGSDYVLGIEKDAPSAPPEVRGDSSRDQAKRGE